MCSSTRGPASAPLFGDVAHQHDGSAAGLGSARQVCGAFPHLRDRTRRAGELLGIHSLDGVDHCHIGPLHIQRCKDFLELDFCQHPDLRPV